MPTPPDESVQHPEEVEVPRWVQVSVGLLLAAILVLCLAGSLMLALLPNEKAPVLAPLFGVGMSMLSLWGFLVCFRLVTGRRVRGGLLGPRALRVVAWFFLLLPLAGLFTGYFITHTLQALVQTAAYISIFFGLRSLALHREKNGA